MSLVPSRLKPYLIGLIFLVTAAPALAQELPPDPPDGSVAEPAAGLPADHVPFSLDGPFRPGAFHTPEALGSELSGSPASSELPPAHPDRLEAEAFDEYRETGEPPVIATPEGRIHPFGQPVTLLCLPYRLCSVHLEPGEVLQTALVGDERWALEGATQGSTAVLLVKPLGWDLATNAVLVTDRRTYHLELRSPREEEAPPGVAYDARTRFWYPERRLRELQAATAPTPQNGPADATETPSPPRLHFGYRLDQPGKKRRLPWVPAAVYDDGTHTYVVLPPGARAHPLPAFLGLLPGGGRAPLNPVLDGDHVLLPGLYPDGVELVLGTGHHRRSLRILPWTKAGS